MFRASFRLVCCAGWLLGGALLVSAGPEDDQKIENALKVKAALSKGCDAIRCGQYREAVDTLETQLPLIGANREYLAALREAYQGLIRDLKLHNQENEVLRFQRRLSVLDPGAPPAPGARPQAEQDPVPLIGAEPNPTPVAPSAGGKPPAEPELDPFSNANSVQFQQARGLMEQADRAFLSQSYADASKLYEQAFVLDKSMAAPYKERWAYSLLYGVARSLNRDRPAAPPQQMEREVRHALSLAPRKFDNFGNTLLQRIQSQPAVQGGAGLGPTGPAAPERSDDTGPAEVRHLPGQEKGWTVCETPNFRLFHKQTAEQAERAARAAESARAQSARRWFGEVPPAWAPRCDLYLHLNKHDYSQETGKPLDCPGHATIGMERGGDQVRSRRVDLHCDDLNMTYGTLPHEVTHVVLAGRFGVQHLPRWADEGMAVLSEPRDRVERHLRNLPQHQRDRHLFAVADLMQFNDYSDEKYIGAFYAQSVSLVDFLCQQKGGTQTFAHFLRDGLRGGYEPALRQHYGINGFLELQNRWQAAALPGGGSGLADRGK